MTTPAQLRFVSSILLGDASAAAGAIDRGEVSVPEMTDLIRANALRLHALSALETPPLAERVPAAFVDEIRRFRDAGRKRQEALVEGLIVLSRQLATAGHEFILLKGPYVAVRFFGGLDRRTFWDVDLLVRPDTAVALERLLVDLGFDRRSKSLLGMALTRRFVHALDYDRPGLSLDLHWLLSLHPSLRVDYERVWRDRRRFELRGETFSVLSDEYEVLTRLLEIVRDFERGATRLKLFADLYRVLAGIETGFDWDAFYENRQRDRAARVSAHALALFLDLFDFSERFPDLAASTSRELVRHGTPRHGSPHLLLAPGRGALRNKAWVSGLYECSRLRYGAWWLGTLPFRLAVYKRKRKSTGASAGRVATAASRVGQAPPRL